MRASVPVALVALILATVPVLPAHAAETPAAPTGPLAQDALGDVKADVQGQSQPVPAQVRNDLDLVALSVVESADSFKFAVQTADVKVGQDNAGNEGQAIYVNFLHGSREFQVGMFHDYLGIGEFASASLSYRDSATADWSQVWYHGGGTTLDPQAETYTVEVPRDDLADAEGAAPFPGRVLEKFAVHAINLLGDDSVINLGLTSTGAPARFHDEMPDAGPGPATYPIQFGVVQAGHARLTSEEPFRASNGEATTFIYKVHAKNIGDAADSFQLRATSVPAGWSVVLPEASLPLDAGSDSEVPVLLTVPFNHVHGAALSFVLEMPSTTDTTSIGRLEMGVRFLKIPQPAGHHSQLFFHSAAYNQFSQALGAVFTGNDGYPFMDALDVYEGDAALQLSPESMNWNTAPDGTPQGDFSWCVSLDPGLQMGLDFIVKQKVHVAVPIHAVAPLKSAHLEASLLLLPPNSDARYGCYFFNNGNGNAQPQILATLNGTLPVDIDANSDKKMEGDLDVSHAADRIPYVKGQNLALFVHVLGVAPPNFFSSEVAPHLSPGGTMTLPLLEYHDDVKGVLTTLTGPALTPLGAQERRANPGAMIIYPLSVANDGEKERSLGFNVTGSHTAWATLPAGEIVVAAHSTARADIVIHVPADAVDGDVADLVIQAVDHADQGSRGLLRLVTTVTTKEKLTDDSALAPKVEKKSSPAWAPLGTLTALALVALARRRKLA